MGIQITREMFQRQDPLAFIPEKVEELRQKHGVVPHFCNLKWRDSRRGWHDLDPLEVANPIFQDVYDCLANKPRNLKRVTKDGFYHQGDLVLSTISADDYDIAQARRDYLANRRARMLRDSNLVAQELQRAGNPKNVVALSPEFEHIDDEGNDAVVDERRPGAPVRGFVNPDQPQRVMVSRPARRKKA